MITPEQLLNRPLFAPLSDRLPACTKQIISILSSHIDYPEPVSENASIVLVLRDIDAYNRYDKQIRTSNRIRGFYDDE